MVLGDVPPLPTGGDVLRKRCHICKSYINIDNISQNDFVSNLNGLNFAHYDCEYKVRIKKKHATKEKVEKVLEKMRQQAINLISEEFKLSKFYEFIHSSYNIVSISRTFKAKIAKLLSGDYDGISKPIPIEDLMDMWKQKIKTLISIHQSNIKKGKDIDRAMRPNYDLAVLLNKYDKYLDWKLREKTRASEIVSIVTNREDTPKINFAPKKKKGNEIADILDDLF